MLIYVLSHLHHPHLAVCSTKRVRQICHHQMHMKYSQSEHQAWFSVELHVTSRAPYREHIHVRLLYSFNPRPGYSTEWWEWGDFYCITYKCHKHEFVDRIFKGKKTNLLCWPRGETQAGYIWVEGNTSRCTLHVNAGIEQAVLKTDCSAMHKMISQASLCTVQNIRFVLIPNLYICNAQVDTIGKNIGTDHSNLQFKLCIHKLEDYHACLQLEPDCFPGWRPFSIMMTRGIGTQLDW